MKFDRNQERRHFMVLSAEEKKERNKLAVRRYRARKRQELAEGDKKAIELAKRNKYNTLKSHASQFIKIATKRDLLELRDKIAKRQKKKK